VISEEFSNSRHREFASKEARGQGFIYYLENFRSGFDLICNLSTAYI
jgi:hypothetical protein